MGKGTEIRDSVSFAEINDGIGQVPGAKKILDRARTFGVDIFYDENVHAASPFVKNKNAMAGLRDETEMTNWMLSKAYPFAVHAFNIRSSSSSVTVLVSTTL
jgi:hypothetical protein